MKNELWDLAKRLVFGVIALAVIVVFAVAVTLASSRTASGESIANTQAAPSEQSELGVVVTNETNTNIAVFSTAGTQGCTVPPGGFCFAQCPPGWSYLTIKVVRCGQYGDMEDPDDPVTFRMDAVKIHRVKPREF